MTTYEQTPEALAVNFGRQVKERRTRLRMSQDDLAFASGVGRRFIFELERGKPTRRLGRALIATSTLGLQTPQMTASAGREDQNDTGDVA